MTETKLQRSLGPLGIALLTLSVLSPAASVFISGAEIVHQAGTGAALAFLLGGIATLIITFAFAELGSSFPIAGGAYAMVGQGLGERAGFLQFGIDLINVPVFLAFAATGIAAYLRVVIPDLPVIPTAIVTLVITTSAAILNIRTNAVITGLFLALELAALALIAALGLFHPAHAVTPMLIHPLVFSAAGTASLSLAVLGIAVASAAWATSGAAQAVFFSEELKDPARVGRLVMWIQLVAVLTMVLPVVGLIAGASNLPAVLTAESPFAAFTAAAVAPWAATALSLAIALAVFNASMAGVICYARWLYSSGRDRVWPGAINRGLERIHPRFASPWVASIVVGGAGMLCCFLGIKTLLILAAACGIAQGVLVNLACLNARRRGLSGRTGTFRAPLFPLTPILSLAIYAVLTLSLIHI